MRIQLPVQSRFRLPTPNLCINEWTLTVSGGGATMLLFEMEAVMDLRLDRGAVDWEDSEVTEMTLLFKRVLNLEEDRAESDSAVDESSPAKTGIQN